LQQTFEEPGHWALIFVFPDDSNLHISMFKQLVSTEVKASNHQWIVW